MIERITKQLARSGILLAQDVQVLAPMYCGQAGIDQINSSMQNLINPVKKRPADLANLIATSTRRQGYPLVNDAEQCL